MAAVMALASTGVILLVSVLFGVRRVLLAVMLIRPSCDRGFDWVKTAFHQSMGPGAAVNLLVIGLALTALVHAPRAFLSPPVLAWGGFLLAALASLVHGSDPAHGVKLLSTLATCAAVFSFARNCA